MRGGVDVWVPQGRRTDDGTRGAHGAGGTGMSGHAVVIAGGGPTGMMLAAELALAKVDIRVVKT
jgi:NADPH-dependent 2,4-dienoyl-CoA reductase/sulfur reductase-like enzyme